jgi:eukaryotic-like serine/threonine-protein kinase
VHDDRGPLLPGQRFAGCIVDRVLGSGATSTVYAAFDDAAAEWRALKVFVPGPGLGPAQVAEAGARFVREAELGRRLKHPGIARLYRVGHDGVLDWLLMELLPGADLRRYTAPSRLLPEAVVLDIGARLARALAHAHAAGIVHRDLKPANVIVDWRSGRVALTDFGLARAADTAQTRTGLVLGSPGYMAPELLAGAPPSPASDLYALGATLYELLTGHRPFEADGLGELLRRVAYEPAPDLRSRRPDLPAALAALLEALLAKRAEQRPAGAAAVADALQALRPPDAGDPPGPMSRR